MRIQTSIMLEVEVAKQLHHYTHYNRITPLVKSRVIEKLLVEFLKTKKAEKQTTAKENLVKELKKGKEDKSSRPIMPENNYEKVFT